MLFLKLWTTVYYEIFKLNMYQEQLLQIEDALNNSRDDDEKQELLALKANIVELLSLTNGETSNNIDDEYSKFVNEINGIDNEEAVEDDTNNELLNLDGQKFKVQCDFLAANGYHNAIVASTFLSPEEIPKVKVLFINPIHKKMVPCPFFLENKCLYSDTECRYSHGYTVSISNLKPYSEPDFNCIVKGSCVLAKGLDDIWQRAVVVQIDGEKCHVKYDSTSKVEEKLLEHILPLNECISEDEESDTDHCEEDIINTSLLIQPSKHAFGEWEQYTKGVGSRLMSQMGYIVGTGLGKRGNGRIDPVSAVVLPVGKSLDYCMELREKVGGDKDFFSADKKMKRLQKNQEKKNLKHNQKDSKNECNNVFGVINSVMNISNQSPILNTKSVKKETSRHLNIESLKNVENIKKTEEDIIKIKTSLSRYRDKESQISKVLNGQLLTKEMELKQLKEYALSIANEQQRRSDKRKMTIF